MAELQALRQTASQAVDTATASDLAKGGEAVGSAAGHDLALGLTTADIGVVVKPHASKRQRVNLPSSSLANPASRPLPRSEVNIPDDVDLSPVSLRMHTSCSMMAEDSAQAYDTVVRMSEDQTKIF